MLKQFLFLTFLLCFISCQNNNSNPNTSPPTAEPKLSFICQVSKSNTEDVPSNNVFLVLDGKQYHLANILACEKFAKENYKNYEIPAHAIDACGGWWAGVGEYFYIEKKPSDRYAIMYGQMYEEKETGKYDYTQLAQVKKDATGVYTFIPKHQKSDIKGVYTLEGNDKSWMLVLESKGVDDIKAKYYEIKGKLPNANKLLENPQTLKQFDIDFSDMVISSDLGDGQYEALFERERITFFNIKSHQEDVLRLTKNRRYDGLLK